MSITGGDSDDVGQARRDVGLAVSVPAPGDHRAVRLQNGAVLDAGRDGDDIGKTRRHIGRAVVVVAHAISGDGAVGFEREPVIPPGGNGAHTG